MRLARSVLVALGCLSMAACLPIPHAARRAAEIHGRVVQGDAPVAGITVKRVLALGREACAQDGETTVTDDAGVFGFERRYQFQPFLVLYGDPVTPMVLCVYRDGTLLDVFEFNKIGVAPREMVLLCDLDRAGDPRSRFCGSPDLMQP